MCYLGEATSCYHLQEESMLDLVEEQKEPCSVDH
jgi:hypothetical protein